VLNDAGDLALDLLVYSVGPDQLAPLPRFKFDGELLGAQVEIYKVVQALASKANPQGFPDALTLPAPVAADYNPSAHKTSAPLVSASQKKAPEKAPPSDTGSGNEEDEDQIKLATGQPKPKGEGEARADTKSHTLTAETTETQALATPGAEETGEKKGGLATWTIVGITVLAVAAAAVGTYFIVEAATAKPSNANLGITW
jgi:hypothetical protein